MRDQLALAVLRILGRTPIRFNQWLGRQLGGLAWKHSEKIRQITLTNLELCYPEKTDKQRITLGKRTTQ